METTNEKIWCVYIHTNLINNKKYIGQTKYSHNPNRRWKSGSGYKSNPYFYNSILKYGWDNFSHEIIVTNLTQDEANEIEKQLINEMNTTNPEYGYNLTYGGESNIPSEETKQKMRENHADYNGENNPFYGKHLTEEHNKKLQDGHREKCSGENHPFYGKKHSQETIEKIRKAHLKENLSIETLEKMKLSHRDMHGENNHMFGKHHSEETKQKIHNANKKGKIIQLTKEGVFIKEWECLMSVEKELGVSHSNIASCCKGIYKFAYGFKWMYEEDYLKLLTQQND